MSSDVRFERRGDRLVVVVPWDSNGLGQVFVAPVPPSPEACSIDAPPTPARISVALDSRGLWGPEVDEALGVAEPTVDLWEDGTLVPAEEDVRRLSTLTGFPIRFFYLDEPKVELGSGFICGRGKRGGGCRPFGETVSS